MMHKLLHLQVHEQLTVVMQSAKLELQTAAKSASLVVGAVLKRKFVNVSNPAKSDVLPVDE